jgi:hypothetical protein
MILSVIKGTRARLLCPLLLVLLAPGSALAQTEPTDAQRAAFIEAIAANGCKMTEEEAAVKLPAAGITQELSGAIVDALIEDGSAVVEGVTLTLNAEVCKK